ncbi:shikimate kinase [Lapidilactobacillus bayanensis]|uniref:shikimate kinase n=1 Tax=Lapidilactobacillus bayanensis TaxID=2485998 RepID=UPI000F7B84A3|nr:shikimate kinase [Lapidilactobacillus bayanensis]
MSIILIGFMGAGKTTVAQTLATDYQLGMADTDDLLSQRFHCPTGQLLTTLGEARFRQLEYQALQEVISQKISVIATGGGIIESAASLALLQATPNVFWLAVDFMTCWQRIAGDLSRPIAAQTNQKALTMRFKRRQIAYRVASNIIIEATQKSPQQLAAEIYSHYQND